MERKQLRPTLRSTGNSCPNSRGCHPSDFSGSSSDYSFSLFLISVNYPTSCCRHLINNERGHRTTHFCRGYCSWNSTSFSFIVIPYNTFGEDVKMLKDSGLTLVKVLALLVVIWTASVTVSEENRRTNGTNCFVETSYP